MFCEKVLRSIGEVGASGGNAVEFQVRKGWNGRNWNGKNWCGRNWNGKNWCGRNWYGQNYKGRNWIEMIIKVGADQDSSTGNENDRNRKGRHWNLSKIETLMTVNKL